MRTVETKKTPGYYADGGSLYLRVTPAITKTWAFVYIKAGKRTEMGLGSIDNLSLEQARAKADMLRKQIATGLDPLTEQQAQDNERKAQRAKMMTFEQCAQAYIAAHRAGWKNPKHVQQWENTLAQYAFPVFGGLDVRSIDTGLVTQCLEPIWLTKNETAGRVRGRIESVLDWATARKYRTGDNPARWRGHLDKLLAKPSKVQVTEHHPALPYDQLSEFMALLQQQAGIAAKCLEFTILTSARTGESIGAVWSEIDLNAKTWTIPAARMKAKREHSVPLSPAALAIIEQMAAMRTNDYIFPGNRKGLSNMAMAAVLKRMGKTDITVHGFRSTFSDWAAESTAYAGEVREMSLAHTIKNQAEAAYRRGALMEKRARLMADWARFCYAPMISADVTPIRKAVQ
ncbi:MAG: tyrosine-type recombinase/integrase [Methylobacter sp.]|nr:tyrosine-type recombinase/integrase [Methylobacter sp.]MDZ4219566.1 tyrosine-type recombinase/integrase [Methylobacter sp.]